MTPEFIAIITVCAFLMFIYFTCLIIYRRHTGPIYHPPSS